jgi:hypothetical protein
MRFLSLSKVPPHIHEFDIIFAEFSASVRDLAAAVVAYGDTDTLTHARRSTVNVVWLFRRSSD